MAELPKAPELVTITTPGGARFSVARQYQDQFQGLVNDLEARQYTIDPSQSGGYNPRFIAGTDTPSQHAFGQAIDVNWRRNPHGQAPFDIPPDVARELAKKYNMTWGGDWTGPSRDAMHFEVLQPGGAKPAFGLARLPTPPTPVPEPTPVQAPVMAQAAPTPTPGPMMPPPPPGAVMPGQPTSLADAFAQAELKARENQRKMLGIG